jgi:phosphoserine phosphatase RsbU/P
MKGKPSLRSILDAFEEGVCLLDEAGVVRCMNAAAEELSGYRQEDLFGRSFLPNVKITQEGSDPGSDANATFDRPHTRSWNDARFRRKDGRVLDVICAERPLGQDNAGPTLLKFRKREREPLQQLALRDIKPKLEAIFDTMADGLIVISEVGDIQLFSSGAEKLFGYRQDEALGGNVNMLMPSPYREAHDGYLATYLNTGVKKIIGGGERFSGDARTARFSQCISPLERYGWTDAVFSLASRTI